MLMAVLLDCRKMMMMMMMIVHISVANEEDVRTNFYSIVVWRVQVEKHYADGRKEITFPNKTKKTIYPGMYEESVFPDGVVVREYPGGRKEVIKPQR